MAIVEDKSSAVPILQAEKTQSDNVRIMPIIPWVFAAGFLGIAITMTLMPDVAEFVSKRVVVFFYLIFAAFAVLGILATDARRVIFGLKRYEKSLKQTIEEGRVLERNVSAPVGLEGLAEVIDMLFEYVKERHTKSVDLLSSNRILGRDLDRLFHLLHSLNEGVIAIDTSGRVLFANRASQNILNVSHDEAKGMQVRDCVQEADIRHLINEASSGGGAAGIRTIELEADESLGRGPLSVSHSVGVLDEETVIGQILMIQDVSRVKRVEKQHFEFLERLTRDIELPVSNLATGLERLQASSEEIPDMHRILFANAYLESTRISGMINSLLSSSLTEGGAASLKVKPIALRELLLVCDMHAQEQCEIRGLNFESNVPDRLPVVDVDQRLLMVAISYVLRNAVKYTPTDGTVSLGTASNEREIIITVSDTGCGMSHQHVDQVFDRSFTFLDDNGQPKERSYRMATASQIVRLHGGEIRGTSQLDEGSLFSIVLPRSVIHSGQDE